VRLASRLVGWELDIRTKSMIAAEALGGKKEEDKAVQPGAKEAQEEEPKAKKAKKEVKKESKKEVKKEAKKETKKAAKKEGSCLDDLSGVGEKIIESLKEAGIKSLDDIIKAKEEGLLNIKGIGEKKAQKIIAEAKKLL